MLCVIPSNASSSGCAKSYIGIGVSKSQSEVDVCMLEHFVRDYLNVNADRMMVVKDP